MWLLGGVLQKDFPKKYTKFTEKYLCQSLFLILLQASSCQVCNFIKEKHLYQCFITSRSSVLFKIDVFKCFTKFTGKHLCWSLFLNKFKSNRSEMFLVLPRYFHLKFPSEKSICTKNLRRRFYVSYGNCHGICTFPHSQAQIPSLVFAKSDLM